ncbi:uncharacterized protein LOC142974604 [Anticarsia gemmatalis]|uniref:uncharacterized protein LOC142974604 n=1 Tax=Anticarsia gemmatalis TaxID=129554 RepID=UPI003F773453
MKLLITCVLLLAVTGVVRSGFVYRKSINGWIKPYKVIATYAEASQRCHRRGAVVASPITAELLNEMKNIIAVNKHSGPFYIGVSTRYYPDRFMSEEGVSLDDMPETNLISLLDSNSGKCLSMSSESVQAVNCTTKLPYMCYKERKPNMKLTECGTFDTGYKYLNATGSCYKVYDSMSWGNASTICADDGAYLAVIDDRVEAQAICSWLGKSEITKICIGTRDLEEDGHWTSVNGEPLENVFHDWSEGHPPKFFKNPCGYLNCQSLTLDYHNCNVGQQLCEKDPRKVIFPDTNDETPVETDGKESRNSPSAAGSPKTGMDWLGKLVAELRAAQNQNNSTTNSNKKPVTFQLFGLPEGGKK